jgi:predicted phosphodiesterase
MKFAVISDIHANLEALSVALDIIASRKIKEIICLGDIVGYGANPNECIELVRKHCPTAILGNHDETLLNFEFAQEQFNENALRSVEWTFEHVTKKNHKWIEDLQHTTITHNFLFVHSSPKEPYSWHYILSHYDALKNFRVFNEQICFFGHTHVPYIFAYENTYPIHQMEEHKNGYSVRKLFLHNKERYLINPGSIGQPRDFNPQLSFGVFNTEDNSFEHIRAEYDILAASRKIIAAQLPEKNSQRLFVGM